MRAHEKKLICLPNDELRPSPNYSNSTRNLSKRAIQFDIMARAGNHIYRPAVQVPNSTMLGTYQQSFEAEFEAWSSGAEFDAANRPESGCSWPLSTATTSSALECVPADASVRTNVR